MVNDREKVKTVLKPEGSLLPCVTSGERKLTLTILWPMSEDFERFRMRAHQCHELANLARDEYSRESLSNMAKDLDEKRVAPVKQMLFAQTAGASPMGDGRS